MRGEGLTAAILVGGHSRRMGTTKALLPIARDGTTVVEAVVRKLRQVADAVVLVGSAPAAYGFLGLPQLGDRVPGAGPLGGIHAALLETGRSHVLVVAGDMPFLSVSLLRHMATRPRDYDVLVPVLGQPQPLHAIYARTCLPHIEQSLRAGRYQVTGWFGNATVRTMERSIVEKYDPSCRSCFNMNTPEDYAFAKRILACHPDEAATPAPPASDPG